MTGTGPMWVPGERWRNHETGCAGTVGESTTATHVTILYDNGDMAVLPVNLAFSMLERICCTPAEYVRFTPCG